MKWDYWICLYTQTHCTARGLRGTTISAYRSTLEQFRIYVRHSKSNKGPDQITAADVLDYLEHLRTDRSNGDSAVNRHVTILKNFYRAIAAMGHIAVHANPLVHFPKIKGPPRKLPIVLSEEQVGRLLSTPRNDTILGLRDRAIMSLLYGTGIRATECASLKEYDVDLEGRTILVVGKGGHQRVLPLNRRVVESLGVYKMMRGKASPEGLFFKSRYGGRMSRNAIYERVRTNGRKARIAKPISPHKLRHTFATHLVRAGVNLVTIRDLLGHRQIASTQIYLHVTAKDLREAAEVHPIKELAGIVEQYLPEVKLPLQGPRRKVRYG